MVVQPLPSLGRVESKCEKQRALDASSKLSGLLQSATEKSARLFPASLRSSALKGLMSLGFQDFQVTSSFAF